MDRSVFRLVIIFLGATLILSVLSIGALAGFGKDVPGILENLAVGALTGIGGLLARSPGAEEAQDVRVVNTVVDAVPTEQVPE